MLSHRPNLFVTKLLKDWAYLSLWNSNFRILLLNLCFSSMASASAMKFFLFTNLRTYPNSFFKCRPLDHLQNSCPSVLPKCARCRGPHISIKDELCFADSNYANCRQKYPFHSFSCPVIKNWIKCKFTIQPRVHQSQLFRLI